MDVKLVPISDVKPYEQNPRKNDPAVEYVMNSLTQFGFQQPIVVDENMVIIAGHTRWKAAKKLKWQHVPCVIAHGLTEEQVRAYRLADNKTHEKSEWDIEKLDMELSDITLDMEQFGFEPFEVEFEAFDGDGDGGGSRMGAGHFLHVVIGDKIFDIRNDEGDLMDLSRDIDEDVLREKIPMILRGQL